MRNNIPHLIFFCELDTPRLQALFADASLIDTLKRLNAGISLGLLDRSDERAQIVRQLNAAGIPVIAWLLLPTEQGYWFNADNVDAASACYDAFRSWTAHHELKWAGVGIDIEPDRNFMEAAQNDPRKLLDALRHPRSKLRVIQSQAAYTALVKRIHADGYPVDAYHIPLLIDERRVGSFILQRVGGLVDVSVDRDVLMLYTSFMGNAGVGMLWSYGADGDSIAVGSTGGGVEIGDLPTKILSWNELERDLRLAYAFTSTIHIFSLEGCVKQGYLARLLDFNWNAPFTPPLDAARGVERLRFGLRAGLWLWAHPGVVVLTLLSIAEWWWRRKRRHS